MTRFSAIVGLGAALSFVGVGAPLSAQTPPPAAPSPAPDAAVLPAYPKNLAVPLLGAKVRVNTTSGIRRPDGFPVPVASSGMPDATALLGSGLDGLDLSAGLHSLTILLPQPVVVQRVSFLNLTGEGTFSIFVSAGDPQLAAQGPGQAQAPFQGAFTIHSAFFRPQPVSFVQIELRLAKPGRIGRLAVYGLPADTDYALTFPAGVVPPAGAKKADLDVAALWSGARVAALASGRPGSDPSVITSDVLGAPYLFPDAEAAPSFDIDLRGFRRADRAVLLLAGPPCKVEAVKIPRPAAPPSGPGLVTVARASGDVQTLNFDGTAMAPAHADDPLPRGKVLNVGYNSVADLDIDGTSFVRVGPNSNVTFRAPKSGKGAELSLLRGSVLWQVYGPGGGGVVVTPAVSASVEGGVVAVETELGGGSRIGLLAGTPATMGGPGPVSIRDPLTGGWFRPRPGEGASLASSGGLGEAQLAVKPFSVAAWWRDSRIGAKAGGLHGGAEKTYFASPMPAPAGEVLGSALTSGGLVPVQITFPEQPLEAVRFRITPLAPNGLGSPVAVVKALVLGLYAPQEMELVSRPDPAARVPAAAPQPPPPVAAAPPPPAVPTPAPVPVPPVPAKAPAPTAPPLPVAEQPEQLAPVPLPAPAPAPVPASPAPPAQASEPKGAAYASESASVLGSRESIYVRQNSKGDPHPPAR